MAKKICRDKDELRQKIKGREKRYICTKCQKKSPKEKWCCIPEVIKP